jgi:hypothetical protein
MSDINIEKIDEVTLALLHLVKHRQHDIGPMRAWKGFDWDTMDRLHEKGYIDDPVGKAKSVAMTEEGEQRSKELFEAYFVEGEPREDNERSDEATIEANPPEPGLVENFTPEPEHELRLNERTIDEIARGMETNMAEMESLFDVENKKVRSLGPEVSTVSGVDEYLDEDGDIPEEYSKVKRNQVELYRAWAEDSDGRFLAIPETESRRDWRMMSRFTSTIEPESVRQKFEEAIDGKGAFSRFRKCLDKFPSIREPWFEYKKKCRARQISGWLAAEGYRLVIEEEKECESGNFTR